MTTQLHEASKQWATRPEDHWMGYTMGELTEADMRARKMGMWAGLAFIGDKSSPHPDYDEKNGNYLKKERPEMKYPYEVYATAFHGGHMISRHHTREAAERAVRRYRMGECVCGCAGIVDRSKGERPGTQRDQDQYSDPYAIGAV